MKKLLDSKISLTVLSLASTSASAHTAHLPDEAVHGFLHVEHIIVITAIGLISYVVSVLRKK